MRRNKKLSLDERIVRIFDDAGRFCGTGTLLDELGWVLTGGHLFRSLNVEDGVSINQELNWTIQTYDGTSCRCEYLAEKFDDECKFDYALIKADCKRSFFKPLLARRSVEEHREAFTFGFSGSNSMRLRVEGRIIGPTFIYESSCQRPLLQLYWQNAGSYVGFSGAPVFVRESQVGVLLAGVQSNELVDLHVQVATPITTILQRSELFSQAVAELSHSAYRSAGFRLNSVRELHTPRNEDPACVVAQVLERMCELSPSLMGQISKRKLANRIRARIAKGDDIVALVVSTARPNRVVARNHLAVHFRRQRWRNNMFEVMTEQELRQLRSYREYVEVFLF